MQTKRQTLIEMTTNMVIGSIGAWAITWGMFTLVDSKLQAATYTTLLCTVWSFFRGYLIRRYFNKLWSKR
jgi:hypothetical protein